MPVDMKSLSADNKASILIEALPYIKRWSQKVVVIKYGGNAMAGSDEANSLVSFAKDIVILNAVGMKPVVVHGGGPQIGELMEKLGKIPEFIDGHRVTDRETLDIARMVLVGKVNRDIVSAINLHGPLAVGLSGEDGGLIKAEAKNARLGYVGQVVSVDPTLVEGLLHQGLIPVIATIGSSEGGQAYNINADAVAASLAGALNAEKLVYLTDVSGVRRDVDDPESLISLLSATEAKELIESKVISGGMVPKVESCIEAVNKGVGRAHILDGRVQHALLVEIFTDGGVGTMVTP